MPFAIPTLQKINIGSDLVGFVEVAKRGYITAGERAKLSAAIANRKTDDAILLEASEFLADKLKLNKGDVLDVLKTPETVDEKIRLSVTTHPGFEAAQTAPEFTEFRKYRTENTLRELHAFTLERLGDAELRDSIKDFHAFANGTSEVQQYFGEGLEVCGLGLAGLLDHLFEFYSSELNGFPVELNIDRTVTAFFSEILPISKEAE